MAKYCVETENLTHKFWGNQIVLSDIKMQVPEGSIYGFLGPNGAGKTTTLRLLLGLLKKQQGTISIFGKPFNENRVEVLQQVGSLIESPSLYGHLTAAENLEVLRKIYQCPKERITEVLAMVGLSDTGKKKAKRFSLGMKQRLSIAVALLHNPKLLVLDEPTNGLDPNGMIEVRELITKLNKEHGITIIVSSHLLAEIEKFVTHVGIIHKGTMLFQGTLNELSNKQKVSSSVLIETNDNAKGLKILSENNATGVIDGGKISMPLGTKEEIAKLNRKLVENGVDVYEISTVKNNLESIFMDLINN